VDFHSTYSGDKWWVKKPKEIMAEIKEEEKEDDLE